MEVDEAILVDELEAEQAAVEFIKQINEQNIDGIYNMMTFDFLFLDAHGNNIFGRDKMIAGWAAYFKTYPDYKIEITNVFESHPYYALFGYASGTYKGMKDKENSYHWRLPTAWKALLEGNKIKEWHVYVDTKVISDLVARANSPK